MAVEVEHVPERVETVCEHVIEPKDDDRVIEEIPEHGVYLVEREAVVVEEEYIVYTTDGAGTESRSYHVRQNDDGDWYVMQRWISPNRGNQTMSWASGGDRQLSTPAVREALAEHDIEVIN